MDCLGYASVAELIRVATHICWLILAFSCFPFAVVSEGLVMRIPPADRPGGGDVGPSSLNSLHSVLLSTGLHLPCPVWTSFCSCDNQSCIGVIHRLNCGSSGASGSLIVEQLECPASHHSLRSLGFPSRFEMPPFGLDSAVGSAIGPCSSAAERCCGVVS